MNTREKTLTVDFRPRVDETADEIDQLVRIANWRGITAGELIAEYIREGADRDFSREQSPSEAVTVH